MNDAPQGTADLEKRAGDGDETVQEKLHRELDELLSELRVVIPGVSVLFAFLLTVPFSSRFNEIESGQKDVFFWLFLATFSAMVLLVTPSVNHRTRFRAHERHLLIPVWNWLIVAGLGFMCLAFVLAIYLVTSVVSSSSRATMIAVSLGLPVIILWFIVPLFARRAKS